MQIRMLPHGICVGQQFTMTHIWVTPGKHFNRLNMV